MGAPFGGVVPVTVTVTLSTTQPPIADGFTRRHCRTHKFAFLPPATVLKLNACPYNSTPSTVICLGVRLPVADTVPLSTENWHVLDAITVAAKLCLQSPICLRLVAAR